MLKTRIAAGLLAAVAGLGLGTVPIAAADPGTPVVISPRSADIPRMAQAPAQPQATTGCYLVTAFRLNVREAPSMKARIVRVLKHGQIVRATTKTTNGFRQLAPVQWSGARYLRPVKAAC